MSSLLAPSGLSVLDQAAAALREACEERLWAQSDAQITDRVKAALRIKAQAEAVLLAAVGEFEARGLAKAQGASSTRAWLTGAHQVDPSDATVLMKNATALRGGFEATGTALATGDVSMSQARVIIRSVGDLPTDIGPELAAAGESLMVGYCQTFDPTKLALIGRRLAECIDPEGVQARDEKGLLDAEKSAHGGRGLSITADKNGAGRYVRGYLDAESGAIIAAALDGLSAPIPASAAGDSDTRSPATLPRRPGGAVPPPAAVRHAAVHRRDQTPSRHHHPCHVPH
ncbi:MAG: 13E12 repeat family protein [Actinomycetota bacterium]|nr:13E12 repeat family protein [Actinomycetota bacterium]